MGNILKDSYDYDEKTIIKQLSRLRNELYIMKNSLWLGATLFRFKKDKDAAKQIKNNIALLQQQAQSLINRIKTN